MGYLEFKMLSVDEVMEAKYTGSCSCGVRHRGCVRDREGGRGKRGREEGRARGLESSYRR